MDTKEYHKKWREANKDRIREYNRRNSEKRKADGARWREENREYLRALGAQYREENREKIREYCRKWRAAHPKTSRDNCKYNHSPQQHARMILRVQVRNGNIPRPNECSKCHRICKPHGHHEDYNKPLEVIWLCAVCHAAIHRKA